MAERNAGPEIERLIQLLARLPGLGPRSARRAALHLIRKREELLAPLADALRVGARADRRLFHLRQYRHQRSLHDLPRHPPRRGDAGGGRNRGRPLGAGARRRSRARYHVLGGALSPLDGIGPDDLNSPSLVERVTPGGVEEVILAVNATVDGQTTAHYITELAGAAIASRCTRLAHGVPVGGELDYLDEGTLAAAMKSRTDF